MFDEFLGYEENIPELNNEVIGKLNEIPRVCVRRSKPIQVANVLYNTFSLRNDPTNYRRRYIRNLSYWKNSLKNLKKSNTKDIENKQTELCII